MSRRLFIQVAALIIVGCLALGATLLVVQNHKPHHCANPMEKLAGKC